jgi:hypothetical protein
VPAITLTVNQPTLPVAHAARVTLAAVIGLALALGLGQMAAREPAKLLWLAADGLWLFFGPLQFYQVERLGRWLDRGSELYVTLLVTTQVAALGWWTLITLLGWLRRRPVPSAAQVFFSGLGLAYLFMPLVHHTVGTDGYFYITDSDNFLAQSPLVRLAVWLAAAVITIGMTWLRRRLAAVPSPRTLHPLARFSEGLR